MTPTVRTVHGITAPSDSTYSPSAEDVYFMNDNQESMYSVKYHAGYIDSEPVDGHAEFHSLQAAHECFTEYFNQLHGDGGHSLHTGSAWVKLFDPTGKCILNTAEQAARM